MDGPLLPVEFARFASPPRLLPVLPAQIRTPFQEVVRRELGWANTAATPGS